jgi:outer membrane lipoprotein-sorting protein
MSRSLHKNTNGGGRLLLFLLLALVLGGIGFAAWRLLREEEKPQAKVEESPIPCISDDKTICRYITSWKPSTSYRFTVDETSGGVQTVTTYDYDLGNPDKIHTTVEGDASYEIITIGNAVYTKAGDTWWKETIDQGNDKRSNKKDDKSSQDFEPVKPTQYSKVGKEACGDLQCYKYEVNDPGNPDTEQFIWFDDKEYKLRKLTFETTDTVSEQTFEYINVKINKPSPTKDLATDECIIPGQSEPSAKPCS